MSDKHFIGYEYQEVTAKRSMASIYSDGYENFGWQLDATSDPVGKMDFITMKFKRDRKVRNKAELTNTPATRDCCGGILYQSDSVLSTAAPIYPISSVSSHLPSAGI